MWWRTRCGTTSSAGRALVSTQHAAGCGDRVERTGERVPPETVARLADPLLREKARTARGGYGSRLRTSSRSRASPHGGTLALVACDEGGLVATVTFPPPPVSRAPGVETAGEDRLAGDNPPRGRNLVRIARANAGCRRCLTKGRACTVCHREGRDSKAMKAIAWRDARRSRQRPRSCLTARQAVGSPPTSPIRNAELSGSVVQNADGDLVRGELGDLDGARKSAEFCPVGGCRCRDPRAGDVAGLLMNTFVIVQARLQDLLGRLLGGPA
jgi:hypothetical protein